MEELIAENKRLRKEVQSVRELTDRAQAQLVLHALYAGRLRDQLYSKETAVKPNHHQLLGQGIARHLTSNQFLAVLRAEEKRKDDDAEGKRQKEEVKARKKALAEWKKMAQAEVNEQWREVKIAWQADVDVWEAEGRKRGKKPKRPRKGKLPPIPAHLMDKTGDKEALEASDDEDEQDLAMESEGEYEDD